MTLAFADVCNVFEYLETLETAQPPLLPADKHDRLRQTTEAWFKSHRNTIDKLDIESAAALLSSLLPERRPDRVYGVQALSLCRILSRSLGLGTVQIKYLLAYKEPGRGDLAACVQRVLEKGGPPALPKVSLHEVDELLNWLASQCRFSDPALQSRPPSSSEVRDRQLGTIFKRLQGRDAKWLVRLILRDLAPVVIDDRLVLKSFHFLMPDLLHFQQDLNAAVTSLKTTLHLYPSTPDFRSERLLKLNASSSLTPLINVKVSRPAFTKARSIEHCLQMLGNYAWVIERKYDGEYAEIHIDLDKSKSPADCIKIFSKAGKDATQDRKGIHDTLVKCLRLDRADCKIKSKAILLGELVVWSDLTRAVLPFEEVRKHVTRSGVYLGTNKDDQPQPHEHLCIVFFDVLLLDDDVVMTNPIEKRREILRGLYDKIQGRAKSAEWKVVEFGQGELSQRRLMEQFAASNAQGCEGLVLKPCGLPYYSLARDPSRNFQGYIKLKKDYIAGLGDEADFAVIGASYNAQEAAKSTVQNLRWTEFHIAAIVNKDQVSRYAERPVLKIVGSISCQHCIPPTILRTVNQIATFDAIDYAPDQSLPHFNLQPGDLPKIGTSFAVPLVFEVLGSGFVKPSNRDFYALRHARVTKLHQDRSLKDCVGFDDLQQMAANSRAFAIESESQENRTHLAALEKTLRKKFERQATLTSLSRRTKSTTSPESARTPARPVVLHSSLTSASRSSRTPLASVDVNIQAPGTSPQGGEDSQALDGTTIVPSSSRSRKRQAVETSPIMTSGSKRQSRETRQQHLPTPLSSTDKSSTRLYRRMTMHHSQNAIQTSRSACAKTRCILAQAVVYLAPCIARMPYITLDLLSGHDISLATSWRDWIRQRVDPCISSPVVDESQAYPHMRRIVLVEVNRRAAYRQVLETLQEGLSEGSTCTDVEIWDWRILESIRKHEAWQAAQARHMVGVLKWMDQAGFMMFESLVGQTID